jgi:hypothetical protein
MTDSQIQAQYSFIKLLICLQASLELFDELKDTPYYRHEVKRSINGTNQVLERALKRHYDFIDTTEKEETYISISRAVHKILDTSLEEMFAEGYIPLEQ